MFPPTNYLAVSLQRSSSNPNPLIRKQCWRVNRDTRSILSAGKSLAGSRSWEEKTLCAAPRAKGHPPHTHLRFLTQGRRQQRWLEFPRTQNYKARTHWQGTNLVAVQNEKLWKKTMGQNLKQSPKSSERPRTVALKGQVFRAHCILTSTVNEAAQELHPPRVPGAEAGDDSAEVKVWEVAAFDEAVSQWWLPTYFASQQQKHFRPLLFLQ